MIIPGLGSIKTGTEADIILPSTMRLTNRERASERPQKNGEAAPPFVYLLTFAQRRKIS